MGLTSGPEFKKWQQMMGQLPDVLGRSIAAVDACVDDCMAQEEKLVGLDIAQIYAVGRTALSSIKTYLEQARRIAEEWRDAIEYVARVDNFWFMAKTASNVVNGTSDLKQRVGMNSETVQDFMTTLDDTGAARLVSLDELLSSIDWLLAACDYAVAHSEDFNEAIKKLMQPT